MHETLRSLRTNKPHNTQNLITMTTTTTTNIKRLTKPQRRNQSFTNNITQIIRYPHKPYPLQPSSLILITLATLLLLRTTTAAAAAAATSSLYSAQSHSQNYYSNNPVASSIKSSVVIPHIKYGQGLNRWSFLSVDRNNHGLYSDLLCPNPMMISKTNDVPYKQHTGWGSSNTNNSPRNNNYAYGNSRLPPQTPPLPTEIWAMKLAEKVSILPCSLREYAVPTRTHHHGHHRTNRKNSGPSTRHHDQNLMVGSRGSSQQSRHGVHQQQFVENRILLINVSLVPFNYYGASPCSKYVKLSLDEDQGVPLKCKDINYDDSHHNDYHINWGSTNGQQQRWSVLENLERFLKSEKAFRRVFYFQVYFKSFNSGSGGGGKEATSRCVVQQYELDLGFPSGNSRYCNLTSTVGGYDELCGEFDCDQLIFPLYEDPPTGGEHRGVEFDDGDEDIDDDDEYYVDGFEDEDNKVEDGVVVVQQQHNNLPNSLGGSIGGLRNSEGGEQVPFNWGRVLQWDIRLLIFVTLVPLVLFGVLVFGLEIVVYFMCCRRREAEEEFNPERSNQLLQNSLNVWENVPSSGTGTLGSTGSGRNLMDAQSRSVSFSPNMTTSVYGREERKNNIHMNMMMMDGGSFEGGGGGVVQQQQQGCETPKVLKSALKAQAQGQKLGTVGKGGKGGKGGQHHQQQLQHHYFEYDHDMPPSYIETTNNGGR